MPTANKIFEVSYSITGHMYECPQDWNFAVFGPSKYKISEFDNIPFLRNPPKYQAGGLSLPYQFFVTLNNLCLLTLIYRGRKSTSKIKTSCIKEPKCLGYKIYAIFPNSVDKQADFRVPPVGTRLIHQQRGSCTNPYIIHLYTGHFVYVSLSYLRLCFYSRHLRHTYISNTYADRAPALRVSFAMAALLRSLQRVNLNHKERTCYLKSLWLNICQFQIPNMADHCGGSCDESRGQRRQWRTSNTEGIVIHLKTSRD